MLLVSLLYLDISAQGCGRDSSSRLFRRPGSERIGSSRARVELCDFFLVLTFAKLMSVKTSCTCTAHSVKFNFSNPSTLLSRHWTPLPPPSMILSLESPTRDPMLHLKIVKNQKGQAFSVHPHQLKKNVLLRYTYPSIAGRPSAHLYTGWGKRHLQRSILPLHVSSLSYVNFYSILFLHHSFLSVPASSSFDSRNSNCICIGTVRN